MARVWFILLFLTAPKAFSEELAAILDMKFIRETGRTAAVLCFDESEEKCHPWATFYLFEAKVKRVLSGELPDKKFKVLFGAHALKKKNFKNIAVTLSTCLKMTSIRPSIAYWNGAPRNQCTVSVIKVKLRIALKFVLPGENLGAMKKKSSNNK